MKLTAKPLALIVFVIMFGGILLSAALNMWNTSSTKVPARYTTGDAAGQYNPADIRGSYLFGEVAKTFAVPLEDLQVAFQIPADKNPADYALKSLETQFAGAPQEIGTASVRLFVAFYLGLPFDLAGEEIYLPTTAAAILKSKGKMTAEQATYLDAHTVEIAQVSGTPAPASTPVVSTTEHVTTPYLIVGKTTFQELLDWGVTKEAIETAIGGTMPPATAIIKDYAASKGIEFSIMKTALQAEIDKVKK